MWLSRQRKRSDAAYAVAGGGRLSSGAGWLVSCSHPACQASRSLRYLREDIGNGHSLDVSSAEGFPPGIRIWPLGLRAVYQSDQTTSDLSFTLVLPLLPGRSHSPSAVGAPANVPGPGSDPSADPQGSTWPLGTSGVFFISLSCCWMWLQLIGRSG